MKSLAVIYILFLLNSIYAYSQITTGNITYKNGDVDFMPLRAFDVEYVTASTAYFAYRDADSANLEKFRTALTDAWFPGKIKFIPYDSIEKHQSKSLSIIISINLVHITITSSSGHFHDYGNMATLQLWKLEKGKTASKDLTRANASIDLYYDATEGIDQSDINEIKFFNYSPGFIRNYLINVRQHITEKKKISYADEIEEKEDLKALQSNTLYIPEYATLKRNTKTGKMEEPFELSKLLKDYPFKYEIISMDKLSDKILSGESIYYLSYVHQSSHKTFTVYESKTAKIIFQKYKKIGYNISDDDFKDLAKAIK